MGLLRRIWRSTKVGAAIDTVRNIIDEGNIVDGVKRTVKEDWTEDSLIGKAIYDSGKYDGKKEGYVEASDEYEKTLLALADEFLKQKKDFEKERDEYERLLDAYEKEIKQLESITNRTQAENEKLQRLLLKERNLRRLANG